MPPPPEESPRCRHRFRGLLLKLGVFLLLGVVVNVAVAWGCAAFPEGVDMPSIGTKRLYRGYHGESVTLLAGIPFLSAIGHAERLSGWTPFETTDGWLVFGATNIGQEVLLPLRPIWPGFAINTIFYAAMLCMLWIAPRKIRRFVRIRGHRCPACGYQIAPGGGIGPVCSECGAALPASWSAKSP
jgi:hypothetical protein